MGRGAPQEVTASAPEVFAIFGPTASGKSDVADILATRLGTGVVSADALQVYRGLPILTNQPDHPVHLVDMHGSAVVAGGTGLYLRAALADLGIPPAPPSGGRERIERLYDADPVAAYADLEARDPAAARAVHPNDRRRVVRALELAEVGASLVPRDDRLWSEEMRRPTLAVGLEVPRAELERRIRERTSDMLARGAVAEARAAVRGSISRTAAKTLGLEELATLPPDVALERIVIRTRRYAAYQRKWMRRIPGLVALDATRPAEEVVDEIFDLARAR